MKGVQVFILLAFFASAFAAVTYKKAVEPRGPFDDLIEQIIKDLLAQLTDPMATNDTLLELFIDDLVLTAQTTDVVVTGTSGILVTDVTMGLLGNFVVKVEVPFLAITGAIAHYIESSLLWPTAVFGDGPIVAQLNDLKIEVSGGLILIPVGVRNIDYKLSIGGLELIQDGLMGGPTEPGHDDVENHLNVNGHTAIMAIETLNHAYFRKLIDEAINGPSFLKKINHH